MPQPNYFVTPGRAPGAAVTKRRAKVGALGPTLTFVPPSPPPIDAIAEWLCFRAPYPTDRYFPSQQAWNLINAEDLNDDGDFCRRVRAVREDLKLIPRAGSALDGLLMWAGRPHKEVALTTHLGHVIGNDITVQTDSLRGKMAMWAGGWLYPIVLPARPTYHYTLWLGTTGGTSGLDRWAGVSTIGEGVSALEGPTDIRLLYHGKDSGWTFPDGTVPTTDVLVLSDVNVVQPHPEFGFGRGASKYYNPVYDTSVSPPLLIGYHLYDSYPAFSEHPATFAGSMLGDFGPGNAQHLPRFKTRLEQHPGFGSQADGYVEDTAMIPKDTIYLQVDDVRSWASPISLGYADGHGVSYSRDLQDAAPSLFAFAPNDPTWSYAGVPAFADVQAACGALVAKYDLLDWISASMGEKLPIDETGYHTVAVSNESGPSALTRAWWVNRDGFVKFRGWMEQTHFASGTQMVSDGLPGFPPEGLTFTLPGTGSKTSYSATVTYFGPNAILVIHDTLVGDRVYLEGMTYPSIG